MDKVVEGSNKLWIMYSFLLEQLGKMERLKRNRIGCMKRVLFSAYCAVSCRAESKQILMEVEGEGKIYFDELFNLITDAK